MSSRLARGLPVSVLRSMELAQAWSWQLTPDTRLRCSHMGLREAQLR